MEEAVPAERVGKGWRDDWRKVLFEGWRRVGEGLEKGWRRVGEGRRRSEKGVEKVGEGGRKLVNVVA